MPKPQTALSIDMTKVSTDVKAGRTWPRYGERYGGGMGRYGEMHREIQGDLGRSGAPSARASGNGRACPAAEPSARTYSQVQV